MTPPPRRVLLVVVAFLVAYRVYVWRRAFRFLRDQGFKPTYAPKVWWQVPFGSFWEAVSNFSRVYEWKLNRFRENAGETTTMFMPPVWSTTQGLNTIDPVLVKHILKDKFDVYVKSEDTITILHDLLGEGIFAINHGPHSKDKGAKWTLQRKTAAKVFTNNKFNTLLFDTFASHAEIVANVLDTKLGGGTGIVEMQTLMFKYTLDSIGKIGFGVEIGSLFQENVPFAKAFDTAQMASALRFTTPGWRIPVLGKLLYQNERDMADSVEILDEFVYDIIRRRKKEMAEGAENSGDILSLFMAEKLGLTDAELRDVVMSFAIAGRDTTACTLSFCLLLLAENPAWQTRLRKEVQSVLGDRDERVPTTDDLAQMRLLQNVVLETLRLFPPVPVDLKAASVDDVLPDGRRVKKGTKIAFEVYCMGRSELYWKNAETFDPDRWIDRKMPSQYEFPVFQAGPRVCLGESMAKFEASLLIAYLVDRYEFSLPTPDTKHTYAPGITMTVKGGLHLRVTRLTTTA